MSSGCHLPPREHASFAVSSRLLSCLVTESLLRAFYLEAKQSEAMTGILVILSTSVIMEQPVITRALRPNDIFAIVPLRSAPVCKDSTRTKHGRIVGLLDPLDMVPEIYVLVETISGDRVQDELSETILSCLAPPPWELGRFTTLQKCADPTLLWNKFVQDVLVQDSLSEMISEELRSSLEWQLASFENPPACPSLDSAPIKWEQSLVAGHPTHPMHRARMCPNAPSNYDWYRPKIHFVRVPSDNLDTQGAFKTMMRGLVTKAAFSSGTQDPEEIPGTTFMPVHEMQLPTVLAKFKDVEVLEPTVDALAQSAIRTVVIPELPNMALKVAINMKISSALRTISHYTANFGPRFSNEIVPKLAMDHNILSVVQEPASAVFKGVEPSVRKHFTAIFRDEFLPPAGQNVAVVASLLEMGHANVPVGVSAVEHAFRLDSEAKRVAFLDKYLRLACEALIPPTLHNGVVFEAHAQNCLLRFDVETGEPLGFVVRDLGGLRVHPPTMNASLGTDFGFLPGHCVVTDTLEETYPKFYHTLIHNHLQRMIRVLGMHYNGVGWEMLRGHLRNVIPADHGLWKAWMETDTVAGKCLMRMRLQSVHDKMVFSPFPNMLQYRPENKMSA
ncbi:IucC family-domain-containing protein [Mycena belliarum]|uniref:IucC family-domain-containing protein n=1 Tax=Mycena belliarum TaxID=1033014 RepID=A0AAD6XL52_9AGAR|nr:IucC family-domain-containing protein [Mycena belliae]